MFWRNDLTRPRPLILWLLFGGFLLSCGSAKIAFFGDDALNWNRSDVDESHELVHTLYLVGDAGELDDPVKKSNYVLEALKPLLDREDKESSLVYLGDNIYPLGLPRKEHEDRTLMESKINVQLEAARDFAGHTYFIPGNHDWMQGRKGGRKAVKRMEEYVESYFDKDNKVRLYPHNACGDPEVKKIKKGLIFVFIDSQWWLEDWSKEPKMNKGCDIKSRGDFLERIEEIYLEHKNDRVVLLMHHPFYSNGNHGAKFSLAQHLLPLNELGVPLPLPVVGSIYPIFRSVTGSKQDIPHVKNQQLLNGLLRQAANVGLDVIYTAGHEHGLQYFEENDSKFIVSGSGSKVTYTAQGGEASYAHQARGFARIKFYKDGEAWVEFFTVAGSGQEAVLSFRRQLFPPRAGTVPTQNNYPPMLGPPDTLLAANPKFEAGKFKEFFLGDQYRDIWTTPVTAKKIDLEVEQNGLTPIKKGGGMASNSLRMKVADGRHYILRSINKDYTKLVPPDFANLKILDVMKDQNSASHPYGALVVPKLSEAAGIYYTTPKLVYLEHQKGLGNYNQLFPEELYLLEERPSGNWADFAQFGNSEDIISYVDMLEILREKKNHFVDQPWVLKSRLFDLLIHDWDRHDDQWRWATFEEEDRTIYRPIPRDRDQVFYKFRGVIPSLVASFAQKKFKTMKEDVRDVKSLSFNARYFDRYFLNDLAWKDWTPIIKYLQNNITNEVIYAAVGDLPSEIDPAEGKELADILIARRNNLAGIARKLYDFINKEVEVSGSDDRDLFEIVRNKNGTTQVRLFNIRKEKGNLLKFDRTFYPSETKEIRLYGLRGKDDFNISGEGNGEIKIRIIGGEDDDEIVNQSAGGNIIAYDVPKGIELEGNVRDRTGNTLGINEYERRAFRYNTSLPIIHLGFTPDDGFWIGGGATWTTHGWRKAPYKTKQSISAAAAPGTRNTFNIRYKGRFNEVLGRVDLNLDLRLQNPDITNYFGLGNETTNPLRERAFHWVRMSSYTINPTFGLSSRTGNRSFQFGPTYRSFEVELTDGRVSTDPELGFSADELERKNYLGFNVSYEDGFQDHPVVPTNGFHFRAQYDYWNLLDNNLDQSVRLFSASTKFYIALLARPSMVLANRLGYERVDGDPQFYHYPSLGNRENLRGYRNNRFRGNHTFFHNIDLRLKVLASNNTILPFDTGILGGFDYGRVSLDGQHSKKWHNSFTVGIWFDILGVAVLQPYFSFGQEENMVSFRAGFNF